MHTHSSSPHIPAAEMPELLFVDDLAVLLGRTPDAIRKALREGRLGPYGQLSGRLFVMRDRFMVFLRAQEIDPNRRPMRGRRPGAS